jgi:hypothetical protein
MRPASYPEPGRGAPGAPRPGAAAVGYRFFLSCMSAKTATISTSPLIRYW